MKKKFKFKLEAILKMRKLKEDQCKMEIGRIQSRINTLNDFIKEHKAGIEISYRDHEMSLEQGLNGQEAQFHPFFVQGKNAHIAKIKEEIEYQEKVIQEKYEELKFLRANVKVTEKLREKEYKAHKKEYTKKQFEKIEEQIQNWKQAVK